MKRIALFLLLAIASLAAVAQNSGGTVFASSASTAASRNSADFTNIAGKYGVVTIDITARTSGTFTFTVQAKDGTSGKYSTVLASAALNATGTTVLKIGPALTPAANTVVNDVMPMVWRVNVAGAATPIGTYSVGYQIIQ